MNNSIIDKILNEWAFRVPNGMPNMDNEEHKSILNEVIIDLGYSEILEEKKVLSKYGSNDSGALLGDILSNALENKKSE